MVNSRFKNDPRKVDTLVGWIILIGFGGVVFLALAQNLGPYSSVATNALRTFGVARWIPALPPILGFLLGALTLAAVQAAEIWPLLLLDSSAEERSESWNQKLRVACTVASGAYVIDALACAWFWPPLSDLATFRYAPTWGAVQWTNVAIALFTLFGLAFYVWLWNLIRRVM